MNQNCISTPDQNGLAPDPQQPSQSQAGSDQNATLPVNEKLGELQHSTTEPPGPTEPQPDDLQAESGNGATPPVDEKQLEIDRAAPNADPSGLSSEPQGTDYSTMPVGEESHEIERSAANADQDSPPSEFQRTGPMQSPSGFDAALRLDEMQREI